MAHQIAAVLSGSNNHLDLFLKSRLPLWQSYCPRVFLEYLEDLKLTNGSSIDLDHICKVVMSNSGFSLCSTKDFVPPHKYLLSLHQKLFPIATYVRPSDNDDFSLLPDIIHDLFCHVPWLLHHDFVDFFLNMGQLFINAVRRVQEVYPVENQTRILNSNVLAIARCFWFTVESGLVEEQGKRKSYGAATLSSPEELSNAFTNKIFISPFKTEHIIQRPFNPTELQATFFIIRDFYELKEISEKMHLFLDQGRLDYIVFGPHDNYYHDMGQLINELTFAQR
ncbi:phenylalanine 4-monooxygenase [Chlamydia vaughanii]|uniref:phenylalanine 4-monooxygenase n=1 Tax=Chlamydia vaughanii TaxID=3112552 RepID=UPI0032B1BB77